MFSRNRTSKTKYTNIIKKNPILLKDIKNQTEDMCITAIKKDPNTLQFVTNQTEEMCLFAISLETSL